MSFYFGYEQFQNNPGTPTDSYQTYAAFDNLLANNGQLGIRQSNFQERLSTNAALNNTYNLPGGAYGSLITDSFSLASLKTPTSRPSISTISSTRTTSTPTTATCAIAPASISRLTAV
jgi:hypothetical protein